MYYLPLLLTILANLFYHIAQKNTSENINPAFSLLVTYIIASILSLILYLFYKHDNTIRDNIKELNWSSFMLGGAVVLLELGFLLSYRVGWNISTASIVSTTILTIILVPVGIAFFKETVNMVNVIGIVVSIIGIMLLNYSK